MELFDRAAEPKAVPLGSLKCQCKHQQSVGLACLSVDLVPRFHRRGCAQTPLHCGVKEESRFFCPWQIKVCMRKLLAVKLAL